MGRAAMSEGPPGGHGTMRHGLGGIRLRERDCRQRRRQSCARERDQESEQA